MRKQCLISRNDNKIPAKKISLFFFLQIFNLLFPFFSFLFYLQHNRILILKEKEKVMGPPKLKRSTSSSLSRNYRLESSLSHSSNRRNSTLTNDDLIEDGREEEEEDDDDDNNQENQDNDHDSLSINSIEREMTLKDRQEVSRFGFRFC